MIVQRLAHWAFRRKVIQCWITECPRCRLMKDPRTVWTPHDRCPSCGYHIAATYRQPTLLEALSGISN